MARYQNSYHDELDDEVSNEISPEPVQTDNQEDTFKKRYGDLRRYSQSQADQYEAKLRDLQEQLEQANKKKVELPSTEEELRDWMDEYPKVAAIVQSIARKEAMSATNDLDKTTRERLKQVENMDVKLKMQEAMHAILKAHPDFIELRDSKEFQDWASAEDTASWIKKGLYENKTDPIPVIDAIDFYKAKFGKGKKTTEFDRRAAAEGVRPSTINTPEGGDAKWSESKVAALSDRDYERFETEIEAAMRSGKFTYDISGGAR